MVNVRSGWSESPASSRHPDACSGHGPSRLDSDTQKAPAAVMSGPTRQSVYSGHQYTYTRLSDFLYT
eukprot:scaffold31862_cov63-Phaeocystis_antarctica.AAC.17